MQKPLAAQKSHALRRALALFMPLALLIVSPLASATTVYRSTDANGVVVFSDTPPTTPGGPTITTQTLVITTPAASKDGLLEERLEAMRESTDRLASERRARERHRAELRRLSRDYASAPATDSSSDRTHSNNYIPFYVGPSAYPSRPHYTGPYRHGRDRHNRTRHDRRSGFNDYPASLIRKGYDPRVREVFENN